MSKSMILYMIRDRHTGHFSPGGSRADEAWREGRWAGKKGKVWTGMGALKNHLRQFVVTVWAGGIRKEVNEIPSDWEIVIIDVVQTETQRPGPSARDLIEVAS
jgi:hypothetical protein